MPTCSVRRKMKPSAAPISEPRGETELGQEVYKAIATQGRDQRVLSVYDCLKPIAEAIARVAQPRYTHPVKFFLAHETQPNALATPGGNVYVVGYFCIL